MKSMYQEERLLAILTYLKEHKRITVEDICTILEVSRDTARRDLVRLEEEGRIIRTRGGALLPAEHQIVKDYNYRLQVVSSEKQVIGEKAATFIKEGDAVILDASTTVQACAEQIENTECTIITNSINSAEILSKHPLVSIHLLGGELHKKHRYLFGSQAIEKLSQYNANKAFIGAVGISEMGLTSAHEEDGMLKKKMIQQAKQVIVLADHTKFGVNGFFNYGSLQDIDVLITDQMPSSEFLELLQENSVELVIAGTGEEVEND